MARGRKRKQNVIRDASGKSRGEPVGIDPAVVAARARDLAQDGIAAAHARDPLAGFTLGRLRLIGMAAERSGEPDMRGITNAQCTAGEAWARLARRHAAIMGYALGSPKSASFVMVNFGLSCEEEPDEKEVTRIRRKWSDCYRALMDAGTANGTGTKVALVTWDVCVNNVPVHTLRTTDFGNLRLGLNALARVV